MNRTEALTILVKKPYKLGQLLGFTKLEEIHNKWIIEMLNSEKDETLLAHRGSYKTTCVSLAIAILMVIKPNWQIIFMRKTDNDVREVIRQVAKILTDKHMQYLITSIYGTPLQIITLNGGAIHTSLATNNKGGTQLTGMGISASLTGKHADIIFTDDIVNVRDRISKAEREATKLVYQELQNIRNRGGRIFNTGTPWHKEDTISMLMPNVHKFDWKQTNLIDKETIELIRQSMTPSLFAANYELVHIADEEALFDTPQFFNEKSLLYDGVAHIDASYGGADGTAFTIAKEHDGILYMYGRRWQKHVDDCLEEIYYLLDSYRAGTAHMERNADKGYLAEKMENAGRLVNLYSETTNKYVKISTYLRSKWQDIRWLDETDGDYINEILDYTENAAHDDSPDSAASLIRQLNNEISYNPIKGGW